MREWHDVEYAHCFLGRIDEVKVGSSHGVDGVDEVLVGGSYADGELAGAVWNLGSHREVESTACRHDYRLGDIVAAGAYKLDSAVSYRGVRVVSVSCFRSREIVVEFQIGDETVDYDAESGITRGFNLLHEGDDMPVASLDSAYGGGHLLGLSFDGTLESDGHSSVFTVVYREITNPSVVGRS